MELFDWPVKAGLCPCLPRNQTGPGLHPPHIQDATGSLSQGVQRSGHEDDLSPPPSADIKNDWYCTFIPPYFLMTWIMTTYTFPLL